MALGADRMRQVAALDQGIGQGRGRGFRHFGYQLGGHAELAGEQAEPSERTDGHTLSRAVHRRNAPNERDHPREVVVAQASEGITRHAQQGRPVGTHAVTDDAVEFGVGIRRERLRQVGRHDSRNVGLVEEDLTLAALGMAPEASPQFHEVLAHGQGRGVGWQDERLPRERMAFPEHVLRAAI